MGSLGTRSEGGRRREKLMKMSSGRTRSEPLEGSVGRTSSSKSRHSTERLLDARRTPSAGSAGSLSGQKRDPSLGAYIGRVRKVAASCDAALEQQKAYFQLVPQELTDLQGKIVGVLTLVEELEGVDATGIYTRARTRTHPLSSLSLFCVCVCGYRTFDFLFSALRVTW